jgi:hypothetical protein
VEVPVEIPDGTPVVLSLGTPLSSEMNRSGDAFGLFVAEPIKINGKIVVRAGTPVDGTVTVAKRCGRMSRQGRLGIELGDLVVGTQRLALVARHAADVAQQEGFHSALHKATSPVRDVTNNLLAGLGDTPPGAQAEPPADGKSGHGPTIKGDLVATDPLDAVEFRTPPSVQLAHRGVRGLERVATAAVNVLFGGPLGALKRGSAIEVPAGTTVHAVIVKTADRIG